MERLESKIADVMNDMKDEGSKEEKQKTEEEQNDDEEEEEPEEEGEAEAEGEDAADDCKGKAARVSKSSTDDADAGNELDTTSEGGLGLDDETKEKLLDMTRNINRSFERLRWNTS